MTRRKERYSDLQEPESKMPSSAFCDSLSLNPGCRGHPCLGRCGTHGGFHYNRVPMYATDTIVAPATAPGIGAVAIVRLSGPRAFEIIDALFRPTHSAERAPLTLRLCDVVDLAEAEAVADIVAARSDSALANALAQLSGALSARVEELRGQVVAIRAHLEVEIDFSDEDIRLPSRREVAAEIERLIADVAMLHDSFARGLMMRAGVHATIIGKPNAGKSSLMNLLLGADRAIVTAIAGTTRDVIEDSVQLGPYALVLNDTAGVRQSTDDVERIGIERTLRSARAADFLIAMFDSSRLLEPADLDVIRLTTDRPGLAILNKRDLPAAISADDLRAQGLRIPILPFSAINLEQAAPLRAELAKVITALVSGQDASPKISPERSEKGPASSSQNQIAISRERHRDALATALEALKNARTSALSMMPPEIVAVDIMAAAAALASITGEVSNEDILDAIFKNFCIGK